MKIMNHMIRLYLRKKINEVKYKKNIILHKELTVDEIYSRKGPPVQLEKSKLED